MTRGLPWRLARREMRAGLSGFRLFLACLALGVAAIAGVGSLSDAVVEGLRADSRKLLGGDIDLRLLHRVADARQLAYFEKTADKVSQVVEMRAMARPEGRHDVRSLVEMKAVDQAYPLVGTLQLDPPQGVAQALESRDGRFGALIDGNLLTRLGLSVGDGVSVGDAVFDIRGTIVAEPDRVASVVNFGPRLMVSHDALAATGLVQPGSQIRYHYRLALDDPTAAKAWIEDLKTAFPDAGWRIQSTAEAAPGVQRFLDRMTLFLTFVGLTALLVGGIGVANAVSAYLDGKTGTIATLKCLGASGRLIFQVYFIQIMVLAAIGVAIGVAVGALAPPVGAWLLDGRLPVRVAIGFYPRALGLAALFGLLTAATFAFWPLARARSIPAASLFRDRIAPVVGRLSWVDGLILLAGGGLLAGLTILTTQERHFAVWFVVGSALTLLVLRAAAWAVMGLAARAPHLRSTALRQAVANLHRPGAPTPKVVLSVGLGLSVLVAVALIEGNLRRQIDERLPERAPSFFFIDIQPDQVTAFDETVAGIEGAGDLRRVPSLRGRIVAINATPVEEATIASDSQWAIRGDRALTYAAKPADGTEFVSGQWWPEDYAGPPLISLDHGLARGFGVEVGDSLTFNVLGRDITATIGSTREIDWRSLRFDFAVIFAPGTLEGAPHSHLAAVHVPVDKEEALERAVTDRFANVSAIRVREALKAVSQLMEGIGTAVRSTASITLLAGALVLAGAVAAGRRRRIQDSVIFKVLGATRGRLLGIYLLEYGILGLVTGVIAASVGTVTAWAVMVFLMGSEWAFLPGVVAVTIVVCVLLTQTFGFVGTWRALGQKAAPLLRNE